MLALTCHSPHSSTYHTTSIRRVRIIPVRVSVHAHSSTAQLQKGTPTVLLVSAHFPLRWAPIQPHMVLTVHAL